MNYSKKFTVKILVLFFLALFLAACAAPKLNIIPDKTALSTDLLKKPIRFTGSGWKPNDNVVIELILAKGVKIKGLTEGQERVALGYATVDKEGNFEKAMEPMSTLSTLLQVGWTPLMKPDFEKAEPLPPGKYEIEATGFYSEKKSKVILELLPPVKKD